MDGMQQIPERQYRRSSDFMGRQFSLALVQQGKYSNLILYDCTLDLIMQQLFKEFALIDLKHFKSGNIALRWRTEEEVIGRTGELTCGNLRCGHHLASLEPRTPSPLPRHDRRPKFNHEADYVTIGGEEDDKEEPLVPISLHPFQLDFEYVEMGEMKTALVKVILCKDCSKKLNYRAERKRREGSAGREIDRSPEETTVVNGKGRPKLHPRRERSRSPVRRSREELIPRRRDRSRSPRR